MNANPRPQVATVSALNVYPVKSCRGIASSSLTLAASGFERDRHWMVVRPNGRFVTQRELPRMALVATRLLPSGLQLSTPGMEDLEITESRSGNSGAVTVWSDHCQGFDQGEVAAAWLTRCLGTPLRLVAFDSGHERVSNPQWTGDVRAITEFSDGFSILAISTASLADLNGRLAKPLPMERFRPNIVLEGLGAYDEDRIDELRSGDVRLRIVKGCTRCSITTTNQSTGVVEPDEPLRTLKSYRYSKELKGVLFGQNVIVVAGAGRSLSVGDRFDILWRR